MKQTAKNLLAFALVLVFASAVLCAALAAPSHSLASLSGCSQDNRAMEMTDCEHPTYLCNFNRSSDLLSQGTPGSTHSNDSVKNALAAAIGESCFDISAYGGPFVGYEHTHAFTIGPRKVSIHLYNSVLTL